MMLRMPLPRPWTIAARLGVCRVSTSLVATRGGGSLRASALGGRRVYATQRPSQRASPPPAGVDYVALRRQRRLQRSAEHTILGLVVANAVVFFGWQKVKRHPPKAPWMLRHFTTSARHLEEGRYYTLLTSVFSHADLVHLGVNALGLFVFGTPVCAALGPRRFLALYLGSGVVSSWAQVIQEQTRNAVPGSQRETFNLGASGAVNAAAAWSILQSPRSTLWVLGIVPLPAGLAGALFLARDLYGAATGHADGVGHVAHLTGALCGGAGFAYSIRHGTKKLLRP